MMTQVALVVAALAAALVVLAGPAYRIGLPLAAAFTMLRWGAYAGVAGVVIGSTAAYLARARASRAPLALAAAAAVISLAAAAIPLSWQRRASSAPPIHDITTDLDNPPAFVAIVALRADAPNSLERPASLAEQQRTGYPELAPITVPLPPDRAYSRALDAAQRMGWDIVGTDQSAGRIEATDTTTWFGFTDDVVVRLTPWGAGTRVDVRSVSRVGVGDVGTNARRIEQFLEQVQSP